MSETLTSEAKMAWGGLLVAHARLTRSIDATLQAEGFLSLDVYDVLLALEDSPDQRMRLCELAHRVIFSPSGLTRMLDRLEKAGWVRREAHPSDRRSLLAVLTAEGLAARERTWPRYRDLIQEHFGRHLSSEESAQMTVLFHRLLGAEATECPNGANEK
ncbi:MAG: MarR family winged helix-turn-helix transcriptional regulator [Fimbriimonas sp.]